MGNCRSRQQPENQPLLGTSTYKHPPLNSHFGAKEFNDLDCTKDDESKADIVIVFPFDDLSDKSDPGVLMRRGLLLRLRQAGLPYKTMVSTDDNEIFVVIGQVPEARLFEAAEAQKLEVPLKKIWQAPYAKFEMQRFDDFISDELLGTKHDKQFFSSRDRQTLIMGIIEGDARSPDKEAHPDLLKLSEVDEHYWAIRGGCTGRHPNCRVNLKHYLNRRWINGFFAMHPDKAGSRRDVLFKSWVYSWPWKAQPLERIFKYFNSKTALYFAFTGYYSAWLLIAGVVGAIVQVYCVWVMLANGVQDLDNHASAAFSVFMACWGTLFLEYWKRYNTELSYRWSTLDLEDDQHERAEFKYRAEQTAGYYNTNGVFVRYDEFDLLTMKPEHNLSSYIMLEGDHRDLKTSDDRAYEQEVSIQLKQAITEMAPPQVAYQDTNSRSKRLLLTNAASVTAVFALFVLLVAFLAMRLALDKQLHYLFGEYVATVIQAVVILLLNWLYCKVAVIMVDYENYRTDAEWESALVRRAFLFQFINSYFLLFYTAFLKGHDHWLVRVFPELQDTCRDYYNAPTSSCFFQLTMLLFVLTLSVQIGSTIAEALYPWALYQLNRRIAKYRWQKSKGNQEDQEFLLGEVDKQAKLTPVDPQDTFIDYNKMVIQYGYISMFSAAFPLGSLCGFLNNLLEIRTDGWKRLRATQRPAPTKHAKDIGEWMDIMQFMTVISITTNIGVICFTSDSIKKTFDLDDNQLLWLFIGLEHLLLILKVIIMVAIPDTPELVHKLNARDSYMMMIREKIILENLD